MQKYSHLAITSHTTERVQHKEAKRGVPLVASHSAPTDLAVDLAEKLNLTLIGFVRGDRMNIYTHNYRIV